MKALLRLIKQLFKPDRIWQMASGGHKPIPTKTRPQLTSGGRIL